MQALAVLPDGRLACGSNDGIVRLWDLRIGAETARLSGHTDCVTALTVVSDAGRGWRLASSASDNTVRLWDVNNTSELCRLEVDASVHCLLALPDGRLATGDNLGRLHWLEIVD